MTTGPSDNQRWIRPTIPVSSLLNGHFIISGQPDIQKITEQYKRIKKPVLSNAFGKSASLVKNGSFIVVASAIDGEGKTYTAINLALSIASDLKHNVILIDGDLRQRQISRTLQMNHLPGIQDILSGNTTTMGSALVKTDIPYLNILPAGNGDERATKALYSKQMDVFFAQLSAYQNNSIIIVDTPSMLDTAQAQVFTEMAGQIIYVIAAEKTNERIIKKALKLLPARTAVNLVLNKSTSISHNREY